MKFNKLTAVIIWATVVSGLAQNNVGTLVTDPVRPFSVSSTHPSAIANEIKGGPFVSSNLAGLSNIPAPRLEIGAIGYATNAGLYYRLTATSPATWSSIDGSSIINLQATNLVGVIPASNIPSTTLTNISGTLAIASGGTGATNAATARTNLGLGSTNDAIFQSLSITSANSGISIGIQSSAITASNLTFWFKHTGDNRVGIATNSVVLLKAGGALEFGAENTNGAEITRNNLSLGTNNQPTFSNVVFSSFPTARGFVVASQGRNLEVAGTNLTTTVPAFFGYDGFSFTAFSAAQARTNLGLGWSALTNTDATNFRTAIGLGITNVVRFEGIQLYQDGETTNSITYGADQLYFNQNGVEFFSIDGAAGGTVSFRKPILFLGTNAASNAATTRTNLGLPWIGLTNTNAATFQTALFGTNTNPVLVSTNGEVISPTNFWQVAPILTTVQNSAPTTNSTNSATNSRNLILQSLGTNIVNTTNTILLPTNTSTFNGDSALVIHLGGSGSATAIRQTGATNNLITLTNFDHAVRFIYNAGSWDFYHNVAYVEPIYFSGTNASANAAASRTNLGLGSGDSVSFTRVTVDPTTSASAFRFGTNNTGLWSGPNSNYDSFSVRVSGASLLFFETNRILVATNLAFDGGSSGTIAATTRTNLGIGATNNVEFRNITSDGNIIITNQTATNNGILFVYRTNNEPFLGLANLIASNNTTVSNETLFRVGVAEATNRSAQFGFRSTNTNGDGVAVFSTFGYNALMMVGPSDRSRTNYATNTNAGVEADIWSISPTNRVATLIDTNTGAFTLHRPIGFRTNETNASPTNAGNFGNHAAWLKINIGTNEFYVPVYQ